MISQTISIPFDEKLLPATDLKAGRLSCIYEHGRIRYLKFDETEVIRMIYFAVRDKDWRTAEYTLNDESVLVSETGFSISYTATHYFEKHARPLNCDEPLYRVRVSIHAEDDGISFHVKGEALASFEKNRIGICVLHPINEYRARKAIITTPDGSIYQSEFPTLVNPHQIFREIRNMQCDIGNGISAKLFFDGDIFETEDQRNWADSSFKTYSTPLERQFPVTVEKDETVEQRVQAKFSNPVATQKKKMPAPVSKWAFPAIGYTATNKLLTAEEIALLAAIPFDHYRVHLTLFENNWEKVLPDRFKEVLQLQTKLELVLSVDNDFRKQLERFISILDGNDLLVETVLVLQRDRATASPEIMQAAYATIKAKYSHISIGYGTDGFFADLNRNRPAHDHHDFVSFSLNPQVHTSDTRSIMENVQHLSDLLQTANSFCAGKKIHISPITLKMRESEEAQSGLPSDYDPRQQRNFGALWTLACIQNLALAHKLTLFEVTGYKGILYKDRETPEATPLYKLLKTIKRFQPKWIIKEESTGYGWPAKFLLENANGDQLAIET